MGLALERGVRIVSNAGGLNPAGLADRCARSPPVSGSSAEDRVRRRRRPAPARTVGGSADGQRLPRRVRHRGRPEGRGRHRGHRPRHRRLARRRRGRRSPRMGVRRHDALAGAVVAGHVLECGTQATGGNFSGFLSLPGRDRPLGFPLAEIASDGTRRDHQARRHRGSGDPRHGHRPAGLRDPVGRVTSGRTSPPASTRSRWPRRAGPRRDRRGARRGAAAAAQGVRQRARGWRNTVELVVTGLDVEAKGAWVREQLTLRSPTRRPEVIWSQAAAAAARRRL